MAKLMVFGGSGVIGPGVLEAASDDARVAEVRALRRCPVSSALPKVVTTKVDDFVLEPLFPSLAIRSKALGRALVQTAIDPSLAGLLMNRDLRRLSAGTSQLALQP